MANGANGEEYFNTFCTLPGEEIPWYDKGMSQFDWEPMTNADGTFICNMDGYVDLTAQLSKLLLFIVSLAMEICVSMLPK